MKALIVKEPLELIGEPGESIAAGFGRALPMPGKIDPDEFAPGGKRPGDRRKRVAIAAKAVNQQQHLAAALPLESDHLSLALAVAASSARLMNSAKAAPALTA